MSDETLLTPDNTSHDTEDTSRAGSTLDRREFLALATTACALSAAESAEAHVDLSATETCTKAVQSGESMTGKRDRKELDFLKSYSTTILESAISLIKGMHDDIIVTRPGIVRRFPKSERLVSYAVTSMFSTDANDERGRRDNLDY